MTLTKNEKLGLFTRLYYNEQISMEEMEKLILSIGTQTEYNTLDIVIRKKYECCDMEAGAWMSQLTKEYNEDRGIITGFEPLFAAQYDDDPCCAPYCKYIFTNKEQAREFARLKDSDFRCITEFEWKPEADRYVVKENWYVIENGIFITENEYSDYLDER